MLVDDGPDPCLLGPTNPMTASELEVAIETNATDEIYDGGDSVEGGVG
jgi:hypothetical protein